MMQFWGWIYKIEHFAHSQKEPKINSCFWFPQQVVGDIYIYNHPIGNSVDKTSNVSNGFLVKFSRALPSREREISPDTRSASSSPLRKATTLTWPRPDRGKPPPRLPVKRHPTRLSETHVFCVMFMFLVAKKRFLFMVEFGTHLAV